MPEQPQQQAKEQQAREQEAEGQAKEYKAIERAEEQLQLQQQAVLELV